MSTVAVGQEALNIEADPLTQEEVTAHLPTTSPPQAVTLVHEPPESPPPQPARIINAPRVREQIVFVMAGSSEQTRCQSAGLAQARRYAPSGRRSFNKRDEPVAILAA